jgi:hypothetical protein
VLDALDRAARVLGELDRRHISLSLVHDVDEERVHVILEHAGGPARELSSTTLLNLLDGDTELAER